jgi:PPP family 3-phenylpropionic acid transporter
LVDGLGVRFAAAGELVYGRVRSFGSDGFIAANLLGGAVWAAGDDRVIGTMLACVVGLTVLSLCLPAPPARESDVGPPTASRSLRRPLVVLFFVAGAVAQLGHATVYAFGTTTFEGAGAPASAIGALWTTGVFAEVVLFVFSRAVFARVSPAALLTIGTAAGVVRWLMLATEDNP